MTTDRDQSGDNAAEDLEFEEEDVGDEDSKQPLTFPNTLATLRAQRNIMHSLPPNIKKRVKALKKLHLQTLNIEAEFFKEVHEMECRYQERYKPVLEKRKDIVNGAYEPTEEESHWSSEEEEEDELAESFKEKATIEEVNEKEVVFDKDAKGVPEFWVNAFRNSNMMSDMIQPHDVPILNHLIDIKCICTNEPMSFILEFHFSPNEYFTNSVLTKEYFLKCSPDEDDPFSFEGPEIFKCTGCTINWNKGKNVTVKTVRKRQKHKSRGVVRVVAKTVQNDSFFNFFTPPVIPENTKPEDVDDDLRHLLTSDFEIGHYIRECLVPRAVLYYTGEALDSDSDNYEEEQSSEEEDDEDGESDAGDKKQEQCKQQ